MGSKKSFGKYGGNHYGRGVGNSRKRRDNFFNSIIKQGGEHTKTYVINLNKRKNKYDRIVNDFKNSLQIERFSAIENVNGHIGCGESHKAIVRKAKEENLNTVLILEDDCKPLEHFKERWPIIKKWLDSNMDKWEVFNGGPLHTVGENKEFDIDEYNQLYSMKIGKCTQFMYINKSAYDKILQWTFEKDWLYDYGFINTDKFKNLFIKPSLTTQYDGYSNTEKLNKKYGGNLCNISYFTVSTKDTPELQRLKKSAEKFGWKLDVLGLEENTDQLGWEDKNNRSGDYGNFSIKLVKELEYVSKKNPDDIVLFTDAWDVVCLDDCSSLYEKFLTFNKDLVFGAEKMCSPDQDKKDLYKIRDVPFPYLNSGFFIGKAGVIKNYLDKYNGEKINDQKWWTATYLENQDMIALDSNALMCLQTWDTDQKYYQFQDNKFTYTETSTNPIFIHANGHIKDKLNLFTPLLQNGGKKTRKTRKLKRKSKRKTKNKTKRKQKGGQVETLHYITISTKDTLDLQRLVSSAKKNSWDLKVLGLEMDTASLGHANKKFGMKLRLVKEYLLSCNPKDLLLFTDAWDVLVFGTKEEVLERFKKFNKSIVFNAEKFCWPDEARKNEYDTLSEEFPFLNSGGYIGKVKDIATCLANYYNEEDIDDQRFWTDQYMTNKDIIGLDHNNEIFVCSAGTDIKDYSFENNKLKYKSAYPLILHANGPGKEQFLTLTQNGGNRKKIAIGFHGQIRTFSKAIIDLKPKIMDENSDYTIFLSTWENENVDEFKKVFPNAIIKQFPLQKESDIKWDKLSRYNNASSKDKTILGYWSYQKNMQNLRTMLEEYEKNNSIEFDTILRLRPDTFMDRSIISYYDNVEPNKIYVPSEYRFDIYGKGAYSDIMAFGKSNEIKTILNGIDVIEQCTHEPHVFHPETSMYGVIKYFNYEVVYVELNAYKVW
jgi:GR25 family glycosyltransferase involved in LPS biosynthesis